MSREIHKTSQFAPVRMIDFSGWDDGWTSTRVAPTRNAPFGAVSLPQPTGPCTANQASAERLMADWVAFWDEVVLYPALSKATKDRIFAALEAAQTWFDDGFSAGGVWCRKREDLELYTASLAQAKDMFEQERTTRALARVEPKTTTPTTPTKIVLPEEQITAAANWWGLTLGVAAMAATAIVIAKARRPRELGELGVRRFRRRYGHG